MTINVMRFPPEYKSWSGMKERCFNPNHKNYSDYGGRGIGVCDRWLNFKNFFADMGSRPTAEHSLDRINNDGDYCPDNCRWATKKEQANNRRNRVDSKLITVGCVSLTIPQWTKEMSFERHVISERLKAGWSEFDAVMTPIYGKIRLITIENETRTIAQWTKEMGYGENVIQSRLKLGWSEYRAVMTPVKVKKINES